MDNALDLVFGKAAQEGATVIIIYWVKWYGVSASLWHKNIVAVSYSGYTDNQLSKTDYSWYWDDKELVEEWHGQARNARYVRLEKEFGSKLNHKVYRKSTTGLWLKQ